MEDNIEKINIIKNLIIELNIENIINENNELKNKNKILEKYLKLYTNSKGSKKYYEKNKETIKNNAKIYMNKIKSENPEKLKEWRKTAYLNQKKKKIK